MKSKYTSLLAAVLAVFLFSGCVTTGWKPENAQLAAALVKPITKNLTLPLLLKNPQMEKVLLAVAAGIDVVFAKEGGMTPIAVAQYVEAVAPDLLPQEKALIASGILDAYQIYLDVYKPQVVSSTDPNLLLVLNSFKVGIQEGVALWKAFPETAAVEAQAIH